MRKNIILADCEKEELKDLIKGLEEELNEKFEIKNCICNKKHSKINNIYRYIIYMIYPIKFFINRKRINYLIGWQQFFTIFYIMYCEMFKVKKQNKIIILNFTYKEKKGKMGKIYKKIIKKCLQSEYVDYIHVPSQKYAQKIEKEFKININNFIILQFRINR